MTSFPQSDDIKYFILHDNGLHPHQRAAIPPQDDVTTDVNNDNHVTSPHKLLTDSANDAGGSGSRSNERPRSGKDDEVTYLLNCLTPPNIEEGAGSVCEETSLSDPQTNEVSAEETEKHTCCRHFPDVVSQMHRADSDCNSHGQIKVKDREPISHTDKSCRLSCCDDEQVWVLRDSFVGQDNIDLPSRYTCSKNGKPTVVHTVDQGKNHTDHLSPGRSTELKKVNGRAPTPFKSGKLVSPDNDIPESSHTKQELENLKAEKKIQTVLEEARLMIAEWCTIAQVIDRLLFLLSLLLTIFAYIFILVVVPAEHNPLDDMESSAIFNSLKVSSPVSNS